MDSRALHNAADVWILVVHLAVHGRVGSWSTDPDKSESPDSAIPIDLRDRNHKVQSSILGPAQAPPYVFSFHIPGKSDSLCKAHQ